MTRGGEEGAVSWADLAMIWLCCRFSPENGKGKAARKEFLHIYNSMLGSLCGEFFYFDRTVLYISCRDF